MALRWVTPATPGRAHDRSGTATMAARLGWRHLDPWQLHALRLATERDGRKWAYTTFVITVPRRAGKTTIRGPLTFRRALMAPGTQCWFTAQTRQDARDQLVDTVGPRFRASRYLSSRGHMRRSQGSEGFYLRNGSYWRVFAPAPDALHGKDPELVDIDEAWSVTPDLGGYLEDAILPAFGTSGGQLSLISTAGHAGSVWFRSWVDQARAAAEAGQRTGIAVIDIGLTDEQADQVRAGLEDDPDSPAWSAAIDLMMAEHPAGARLDRGIVAQHARRSVDGALRAYGNVWTKTAESAFPIDLWRLAGREQPDQPARVGVGFDVTPDGTRSALAVAWRDAGGNPWLELVRAGPSSAWLPAQVAAVAKARGSAAGYDTGGTATLAVADEVARRHKTTTLRGLTLPEYATSCATVLTAVRERRLRHTRQPELDAAVQVTGTRPVRDGGFAWSRVGSAGSICELVAATVALRVFDDLPKASKPRIIVSGRRG